MLSTVESPETFCQSGTSEGSADDRSTRDHWDAGDREAADQPVDEPAGCRIGHRRALDDHDSVDGPRSRTTLLVDEQRSHAVGDRRRATRHPFLSELVRDVRQGA